MKLPSLLPGLLSIAVLVLTCSDDENYRGSVEENPE
jgi:hypothetical protein